ncbi:hypothetical protein JCM33374_g6215 [Metschnikowia sp. JCM 33374]|nr:hypothetical protein JCM33374_g6215 [Metschnikowia sp. JCM 33374]
MADPLEMMHQACQDINNNNFESPGPFTNAVLARPEITTMIRDALPSEQGLYRISKGSGVSSSMVRAPRKSAVSGNITGTPAFIELKPERVDGKSIFVDHEVSLTDKIAARAPQLVPRNSVDSPSSDNMSSPTRRRMASQSKLFPPDIFESEDITYICNSLIKAVEQHPGLAGASEMKEKAVAMREEYDKLAHELDLLQQTVTEQKQHLDRHHETLIDFSPTRGGLSPSKSVSVADLIQQEEERIVELETELNAAS